MSNWKFIVHILEKLKRFVKGLIGGKAVYAIQDCIVFFRVVSRKLLKTGSGNRENLGFYVNSRNYI